MYFYSFKCLTAKSFYLFTVRTIKIIKFETFFYFLFFHVVEYGPALIEHVLLKYGFTNSTKIGKSFDIVKDIDELMKALNEADLLFQSAKNKHSLVSHNSTVSNIY